MEEAVTNAIIKIAVVGPESTGKSTLSAQLAEHFNTVWVPEYAREYLTHLGRTYNLDDLYTIARGQLEAETRLAHEANQLLICDTTLTVIKIWAKHVFAVFPDHIEALYKPEQYALHLLTDIDVPWEDDPLREHPQQREHLFNLYEQELKIKHIPYTIIRGDRDQRLRSAIHFIEEHLKIMDL
jgi:NadR type nicotinamide-nucleotide adenylyltransferase